MSRRMNSSKGSSLHIKSFWRAGVLLCGHQDVLLPLKPRDSQDGIVGNGSIREELMESGPCTPLHQYLTFSLKQKQKNFTLACGVFERAGSRALKRENIRVYPDFKAF